METRASSGGEQIDDFLDCCTTAASTTGPTLNVDMIHVPYRSVQYLTDLIGGQVQVIFDPIDWSRAST